MTKPAYSESETVDLAARLLVAMVGVNDGGGAVDASTARFMADRAFMIADEFMAIREGRRYPRAVKKPAG